MEPGEIKNTMLEIRPNCENCNKKLEVNSEEAMICAFECTFCRDCVQNILENVCPNCGGGFEKRPIRPKKHLQKYPPSTDIVLKPINMEKFKKLLELNKNISPDKR